MGKKIIGVVCAVFLFLMLISMVNATLVYQEDANWTDSAGALTDGNWDTFINSGDYLMNYTKPNGASITNSLWEVKDHGAIANLSINSFCWNKYPDNIIFKLSIQPPNVDWLCWKGLGWKGLGWKGLDGSNNWEVLRRTPFLEEPEVSDAYEEAIYWDIILPPVVNITSPANNTSPEDYNQTFSCNLTSGLEDLVSSELYIWNSTGSIIYSNLTNITGTSNSTSWDYTLPYADIFLFNCLGTDAGGYSAWNILGNYTIIFDETAPSVTINSPLNQTYSSISTLFNITAIDGTSVDTCLYSLNGGTTNISLTNSGNYWTTTNASMTQGSHTANFYCNDTLGNLNNTEKVTFFTDSISPLLSIVSPSDGYNIPNYVSGSVPVLANFSLTETNPSSCWYTTNSGTTNTTVTCSAGYNNFTFYLSSAGTFTLKIYSNDSAGNSGSDQINISMTAYSGPQKGSGSTGYEAPSVNDSASLNMTDLPEDFQDYNKTLMCKNIGEFIIEHPTINETDKQNLISILSLELGFGVSGEVVDYYLENYQGVCIGDQPLEVTPEKSSDKNSTAWIIIFVVVLSIIAIVVVTSSKKK